MNVVKFSREFNTGTEHYSNFQKSCSRVTEHGCNLPTGLGKSLTFQALPLVIDHIEKQPGHISCVVVSALLSLVDDQVTYLRRKEVTAASISSCTEEKVTLIEKGKVSVDFG